MVHVRKVLGDQALLKSFGALSAMVNSPVFNLQHVQAPKAFRVVKLPLVALTAFAICSLGAYRNSGVLTCS